MSLTVPSIFIDFYLNELQNIFFLQESLDQIAGKLKLVLPSRCGGGCKNYSYFTTSYPHSSSKYSNIPRQWLFQLLLLCITSNHKSWKIIATSAVTADTVLSRLNTINVNYWYNSQKTLPFLGTPYAIIIQNSNSLDMNTRRASARLMIVPITQEPWSPWPLRCVNFIVMKAEFMLFCLCGVVQYDI